MKQLVLSVLYDACFAPALYGAWLSCALQMAPVGVERGHGPRRWPHPPACKSRASDRPRRDSDWPGGVRLGASDSESTVGPAKRRRKRCGQSAARSGPPLVEWRGRGAPSQLRIIWAEPYNGGRLNRVPRGSGHRNCGGAAIRVSSGFQIPSSTPNFL